MKRIFLFSILTFCFLWTKAQNISGIINDYAEVTAISINVLTLDNATNFNIGDRVMVIKMKGASIDQSNTNTYGDTVSMNDAGRYLFADIIAKTANDVTLDTFCNIFDTVWHIQMVRVPIYPNPTINAPLTCAPWNGTTGGILALETAGTLTFNADINVSELGFRGGVLQGATFNCGSTAFFSPFPGPNGSKGEGIAEYIVGQEGGGGKLASGGGGAYAGNSGAGGGGNGGAGGRGGNQYSGCSPVTKFGIAGLGVAQQSNTMFLGGGGGGPQADNGQTVFPGGNGGGLVYIKAATIDGNAFSIESNGGDVDTTNDEGSGAGGAGGSIFLDCTNFNGALSVNAQGGKGGSNLNTVFTAQCHGPGGGGGGGIVWFAGAATPAGVTTNVIGGLAGFVLNTNSSCFNTTYSAADGATGVVDFNFVPIDVATINVDLGPDVPICIGQTINLDAGAGFVSYLWDDLSINQTRSVNGQGTYHVTVLNSIGCVGSDTINVFLDTSVQAAFSTVFDFGCSSDSVYFINNSIGASNFLWSFGDGTFSSDPNPLHIYGAQGTYPIRLVAGTPPCTDTLDTSITIAHTVEAILGITADSLCLTGTPLNVNAFNSQPLFAPKSYLWDLGDSTTSNAPFVTHNYASAGTYTITLTVTDTIGCTDVETVIVQVEEPPILDFTISEDTICIGETIYFLDSLGNGVNNWVWEFGDGSPLANVRNPKRTYDLAGVFTVSLTGSNAFCPDYTVDTTVVVNDFPLINLGEDKVICPDAETSVSLENEANSAAILEWSTGEVSPNISTTETGYFWARSNNNGCISTDSVWVKRDCYLNIPNAFSPSGDGLNDYFFPRHLLSSGLTAFSMKIFNRWGEMIFETDNINGRGWDGRYGGKNQPMGVYVYLIDAEWRNGIKKSFQGNLTLIR